VAKNIKKTKEKTDKKSIFNPRNKMFFGLVFVLFSVALLLSFISFYIYGHADQSILTDFADRAEKAKNWLGKFGAFLADAFLYKGFGIASFLFVRLLFLTGIYLILDLSITKLKRVWFWDLFAILVLSVLFGFFNKKLPETGGVFGFEMNSFLQDYLGRAGTILILILGSIIYLIFKIKISPERIKNFMKNKKLKTSSTKQLNKRKKLKKKTSKILFYRNLKKT